MEKRKSKPLRGHFVPTLLSFLINAHDPLRVHVLKHIRQNSLTGLRYSVVNGEYMEQCPLVIARVGIGSTLILR